MLRFPINLLALVAAIRDSSTAGTFFEVGVREPAAEAEMAADCKEGGEEDFGVSFRHEGFPPHYVR